MPIVKVEMIQGRTPEQIEKLIESVAKAVNESIGAPEESIRVMVKEYPNTHWGIGTKQAYKLGR
ncbi:2-hydroxymuconate tautomerase [Alteromonas sp. RKMC-009]|uniref:2-hydroxymuconate tautomerase n=1 Tax=Alteromonas sp. RKMC-009 TaxID=2267264 RepID=UPI000E69C6DB|nr:2-hydroxymuconate tautomerase [Alteromonas sp. RKMC-009]AYA63398.1 4-oxalocrotonate tautomerase [Alteromonas sp. RKMC-009]